MPFEEAPDLFSADNASLEPLATRMCPRDLDEFFGQECILGPGTLLRRSIERDVLSSLILSGPPGSGKTALARVVAARSKSAFYHLSAVFAGVKDLRKILAEAETRFRYQSARSILFVDEVHRWNTAQQDALLPWIERGIIIFIGATTENPFFEINNALISRSRVFVLEALPESALERILQRSLDDRERGYGSLCIRIDDDARRHLVQASRGDARILLNALQFAVETNTQEGAAQGEIHLNVEHIAQSLQEKLLRYDKHGDEHYDTISAFIKSVRGSDVDAALYWLAKMLSAGELPRYIFRRLLVLAAEDIGMADPMGIVVVQANAAAAEQVGMPEARYFLSMATIYLATAAKSNSTGALFSALAEIEEKGAGEVPTHLKDSARDAEASGHGKGYKYPHDYPGHWVPQRYLPDSLEGRRFYEASAQGYEETLRTAISRRKSQGPAEKKDTRQRD